MKQPIRHHYIPRFLIRPFCDNQKEALYYDKHTKTSSVRTPEEIFMARNLYRDSINNADNPVQIENDLSKFENEASHIIAKLRKDDDILISTEDEEKLRIFYAIMGFRSERTAQAFGDNASEEMSEYYSFYQEDGNLTDFWKRNLGALVNCRSLREILNHPSIDDPIKLFMRRDAFGILGIYPMVIERRGGEDFILGDSYPLVVEGVFPDGLSAPVYWVYPISPSRALIYVANGAEGAPPEVTGFEKDFFAKPRLQRDRKTIKVPLKKVYEKQVRNINQMIINASTEGLVFQNNTFHKYF